MLVWGFSSPPALCNVLFFPPKTVSHPCRPCNACQGLCFPWSEIPQQCLLFPIPHSSKNFQVLFSLASPSKCIQVWQVLTTCTLASWVCCLNRCNRLLTGLHPSTCAPSLSLLNTATRVRLPARRSGCVTPQVPRRVKTTVLRGVSRARVLGRGGRPSSLTSSPTHLLPLLGLAPSLA